MGEPVAEASVEAAAAHSTPEEEAGRRTPEEEADTYTLAVGAGTGTFVQEVCRRTSVEADSRCILEAVGRRIVQPAAAHSTPEEETGRRIFGVAADRRTVEQEDSMRLLFHISDHSTLMFTTEAPFDHFEIKIKISIRVERRTV